MKKILLGIGSLSLASLPIIAVISCGDNDGDNDKNEEPATLTINFRVDPESDQLIKIEIPKILKFIKDNKDAKTIKIIVLNRDNTQKEKTFDSKDSTVEENIEQVKQWIRNMFEKNGFHFDPFQNLNSK